MDKEFYTSLAMVTLRGSAPTKNTYLRVASRRYAPTNNTCLRGALDASAPPDFLMSVLHQFELSLKRHVVGSIAYKHGEVARFCLPVVCSLVEEA